jgi:peptide-methionine (S)-S-oxide reductase
MKRTIVLGGGCFWCTEAIFRMLSGVISVEPGYAGGSLDNPDYEQVSTGITGHAEVIKIDYDSEVISFENLLTVFFATHNPATINRQGSDVGAHYRSIILYTTEGQKEISEKFIAQLNDSSQEGKPVATQIGPLKKFYSAEGYHKNYYENNKNQSYCVAVINPKLAKVQKDFAELLRQ